MGYGKKIFDDARMELERRRQSAEEQARQRLDDFYAQCPRALEIRGEMARNAANAVRASLDSGNVHQELNRMKGQGLALNREYEELLKKHGLTQKDITPQYTCPHCHDTGFVDGRACRCLKQLQRDMAYRNLSLSVPLEKSTFQSFSLEYYKDDEKAEKQMEKVLKYCRNYAEKFSLASPSLLFRGKTGLGKTHLSLAIANAAIEKGFGVIYGSAQSFAIALEKERFDKEDPEEPDTTNSQLISCDLLILDDLGTEFSSSYVNAALYNIVNTRMLADKPTIISTNLMMKDLEERYSERFASRIAGYYGKLEFLGGDIRVKVRAKRAASKKDGRAN